MKRILLIAAFVLGFALNCEARVYVIVDKATGKACGTADIADTAISEWKERYAIIEAGEDFRGKQSYEIKYENNTLSFEGQERINEYQDNLKKLAEERKKAEMLETLGITEEQLEKIRTQ